MFMSSDEAGAARRAIRLADPVDSASPVPQARLYGSLTAVDVRRLPQRTEVIVDTRNSRYRLVMLEGNASSALIQGGPYFREETPVRIEGSALTGSLLKIGWIGIGLFMEISAGDQRIVTSRVRTIVVEPGPGLEHSDSAASAA
jgi:hypothetical protein